MLKDLLDRWCDNTEWNWLYSPDGKKFLGRKTLKFWGRAVRLHYFVAGDQDEFPHDHPFHFTAITLFGGATETFYTKDGIERRTRKVRRFIPRFYRSTKVHRILSVPGMMLTLVFQGKRHRKFGFVSPDRGWFPYDEGQEVLEDGRLAKHAEHDKK